MPVAVRRWDTDDVRNVELVPSGSFLQIEPAVRQAFGIADDFVCKIYFCTDMQRPRQTRVKVDNPRSWQQFWALSQGRAEHSGLVLHVAPRAVPGSPEKEPHWLKIDTSIGERSSVRRPGNTASSSAASNVGEVQTPRSPLLRDATLHRDFDPVQQLSYCVFCGVCRDPGQLQAAHLIPNSVAERYGLDVSEDLLGVIGGYYETTLNAVSACTLCHPLFDGGVLWAEPAAAGSVSSASSVASSTASASLPWQTVRGSDLVLRVDASLRSDHSKSLSGRRLRLPGGANGQTSLLPFPVAPVWEWRRRWAPLRSEDALAEEMGKLGVSGPCDRKNACMSSTRQRNKNCTRRMCLQCCQATLGEPACKLKEHQPRTLKSPSTS